MKYPEQAASAAEAFAANVSAKAPVASGLWVAASWLTSSQAGILAGMLVGILGLCMNWWFKTREDKRRQLQHEAYMRKLMRDTVRDLIDQPEADE